jgi:aminoglycoside/choline kinase family phosphotransferase
MEPRDEQRDTWLAAVLDGRVARVEPSSGDASFRRYFRVHCGPSPSAATRILMDAPPAREDCRPFVHVARLLADAGLHVPQVLAADLERGFLLLSDLGDRLYLDSLDDANANADALYADAIDALVAMQSRADAASLAPYDADRLHAEMQLFPHWFLDRHLGLDTGGRTGAVLAQSFALLTDTALAQPTVFVHRDYHSRNLMHVPEHNPGVLDFQDAVRGPVSYDLVSLLRDVYVRWPEPRVEAWMVRYHGRATAAGVLCGVDLPAFRRWFDLMGVQRHLKIAGIFARLNYRDGKSRYLDDIGLTLRYLVEITSRHDELSPLATLIGDLDLCARHAAVLASREPGGAPSST